MDSIAVGELLMNYTKRIDESSVQKKALLLVGASQALMDITKKILERVGYSVYCANETVAVWEQLSQEPPDAIILLDNLEDGYEIEFCSELRKATAIPILYTSNSKEDELFALQAGANDFLKKPFDYNILKARLSVMLHTKVNTLEEDEEEKQGIEAEKADLLATAFSKQGFWVTWRRKITRLYTVKRYQIIAAACLILAVVAVSLFFIIRDRANFAMIPEGPVPLTEQSPP